MNICPVCDTESIYPTHPNCEHPPPPWDQLLDEAVL
jgi:hypothetical protein